MATSLGRTFPPAMDRTPPHMSPEDYEIYQAWWPSRRAGAIATYYDVGVGFGSPLPDSIPTPENYERMWLRLTQKRIDMIAEWADHFWLIELRHAATANAVGRLLIYKQLWDQDPAIIKPYTLYLVTNHLDRELMSLSKAHGIIYQWV